VPLAKTIRRRILRGNGDAATVVSGFARHVWTIGIVQRKITKFRVLRSEEAKMYTLYHLFSDKRYKVGYRKVKLLNGSYDELEKYVDLAMSTCLGKRGAFRIEKENN
jgi:hypothetical protein